MFGGLMLSSTLVVVEKKSRAFFRVFTTPTRNQFYIWTTFFTSFTVVMIQLLIIYGLMKAFFIDFQTSQLLTNALLLVIATSMFTMMGMGIGYVMKNQQGANMVSIAMGSLFLFLSNIVLPLETVSSYLQIIAQYNPFVIASDVLRQSIIFQTPISSLYYELGLLSAYTVVIFILIVFFHNLSKTKFVQRLSKNTQRKKEKGVTVKDIHITTEKEMLHFVNNISEKEFNKLVKRNRQFRRFIREEVSDAIGRRAHKLNKAAFLKAIEERNQEMIAYLEQKKPLHKLGTKQKKDARKEKKKTNK
jgi:hypothetical protein